MFSNWDFLLLTLFTLLLILSHCLTQQMDIESTEPPAEKVICYCFKRRPKKKPAEEQREISRNHILLLENEKVYLKKDSISVKHSETVYTSSKSLSSFDFRKETYDEKLRIGLKSCLKGDLLKKYSRKMRTHLRLLYVDKDYSRLEWGRTKTRHNSGLFVTDILRFFLFLGFCWILLGIIFSCIILIYCILCYFL